ncbi:Protein of unknown function (DUF674 [Striga hermonthica]|uniref:Uncharacterized protein n=1 Tax=Striga hermonthica TaxID=68872 RepID=A0A9N7R6N7_STRHE|nr:Protein of unknown function (DUF674 [Striga hermonthica]
MPDTSNISFSLTALIDKESKKVLLAEADNDFIDILLSFMTLPLGTIMKVLLYHGEVAAAVPVIGSLTTLYRGLSVLSDYHFWEGRFKPQVISPRRYEMDGVKLKLQIGSEIMDAIPNCSKRPRTAPIGFGGEGFTEKSASFMISDDLKIVPVEPGYVRQTLTNVGITEMDKAEIRTRTLDKYEV